MNPGEVITFYSYAGGAGRSMALANVATLLAGRCLPREQVLMVDWNLEAPGLHRYFRMEDAPFDGAPGLMDLFIGLEARVRGREIPEADAEQILTAIEADRFVLPTPVPNLSLLKGGRFDGNYFEAVNGFDWRSVDQNAPWLFPALVRHWRARYRWILIDSCSGVSDMSGLCTMMLPDRLVALFALNRHSIDGVSEIVRYAAGYRQQRPEAGPLRIYPVPARVEWVEGSLRDHWQVGNGVDGYQGRFERLFQEIYGREVGSMADYFAGVQIPYVPRYSFGEEIAVLAEPETHRSVLSRAWEELAGRLVRDADPWQEPAAPESHVEVAGRTMSLGEARAHYLVESQRAMQESDIARVARLTLESVEVEEKSGATAEARRKMKDAVALVRGLGDQLLLADALDRLGCFESRNGDWEAAAAYFGEAASWFEACGRGARHARAVEMQASAAAQLGRLDESRKLYKQAIDLYRGCRATLGLASAWRGLGDIERLLGGVVESHYLQAIDLYRAMRETTGLAVCLRLLAELQRKRNRLEDAHRNYEQAAELYRGGWDDAGLAAVLEGLADMERRLKRPKNAERHYQEAIQVARGAKAEATMAAALTGLADLESRMGRLNDSFDLHEEAVAAYQRVGNRLGTANALRALGDVLRRLSRLEEAGHRYANAMDLYEAEGHVLGQANCLQSLGDLEKKQERWTAALALYQQAIQQFRKADAALGLANAIKSLGDVESAAGNFSVAKDHYEQAIESYKAEHNNLGLANAWQALGDLHRRKQYYPWALEAYRQAHALYHSDQNPMGLAYTLAELARVCHATFDFDASIRHLDDALAAAQASRLATVQEYVLDVQREIRSLPRVARR